jgi:hypothetical protein
MEKETENKQKRTDRQNRALHLYFQFVADTLNEAGLDMRKTLKPEVSIDWTPHTVKEYLWRPVQKVQLGKTSTTELNSDEITKVWETINCFLGENHGVHTQFPSIEDLMREQADRENRL